MTGGTINIDNRRRSRLANAREDGFNFPTIERRPSSDLVSIQCKEKWISDLPQERDTQSFLGKDPVASHDHNLKLLMIFTYTRHWGVSEPRTVTSEGFGAGQAIRSDEGWSESDGVSPTKSRKCSFTCKWLFLCLNRDSVLPDLRTFQKKLYFYVNGLLHKLSHIYMLTSHLIFKNTVLVNEMYPSLLDFKPS